MKLLATYSCIAFELEGTPPPSIVMVAVQPTTMRRQATALLRTVAQPRRAQQLCTCHLEPAARARQASTSTREEIDKQARELHASIFDGARRERDAAADRLIELHRALATPHADLLKLVQELRLARVPFHGPAAASALARALSKAASRRPLVFNTVTTPAKVTREVDAIEGATRAALGEDDWHAVLHALERAGAPALTLAAAWEEARARGVQLDYERTQPAFSAVLTAACKGDDAFDQVASMYADLGSGGAVLPSDVYARLIVASCNAPPVPRLQFALDLMRDLKAREVALELDWDNSVNLVRSLMRAVLNAKTTAPAERAAFALYDNFVQLLPVRTLDTRWFNHALQTFIHVALEAAPEESLHPFTSEFLRDMRTRPDCAPDRATYTILLDLAAKQRDAAEVRRLHGLIKLDGTLDPDTPLMNALMNAYNFCGDKDAVLEIWHTMRHNRHAFPLDRLSVSVIMDALGYVRTRSAGERAMRIWRQLERERFDFSPRNWDSYIECLLRTGCYQSATDVLTTDAPKEVLYITAEKYLRFNMSSRERFMRARELLKGLVPHYWSRLETVEPSEGIAGLR